MQSNEMVGSQEAADILGLNYHAFYKRYSRGVLPFEPVGRIGGQHLWRRSDVNTYARMEGITQ